MSLMTSHFNINKKKDIASFYSERGYYLKKKDKMKINIKPISVNKCWQGRRFKTKSYKQFEKDLLALLPNDYEIPTGDLKIALKWGFSSKLSDWDNPIKPIQDILQKKYDFNDCRIFRATVEKEIVKKGEEYIEFKIDQNV